MKIALTIRDKLTVMGWWRGGVLIAVKFWMRSSSITGFRRRQSVRRRSSGLTHASPIAGLPRHTRDERYDYDNSEAELKERVERITNLRTYRETTDVLFNNHYRGKSRCTLVTRVCINLV